MLGKIISIDNNIIDLSLNVNVSQIKNIIDLYVLINDSEKNFVGEIFYIKENIAKVFIVGELINDKFTYGVSTKPSFASTVNLMSSSFVQKIIGIGDEKRCLYIGKSEVYPDVSVGARINSLFGEHFSFIGSTGSGKSCGFARTIQNLFTRNVIPKNANIIIMDSFGEYHQAFSNIGNNNFKAITTNLKSTDEKVMIPVWLLDVDDLALLLNIKKNSQLPILNKTLKFLNIFKKNDETSIKCKTSIIANALLEIISSGRNSTQIRDQIFSVLSRYNTKYLSLDTLVTQPGYTRSLRQCLLIDESGKIRAMELVVNFITSFVIDKIDLALPDKSYPYSLHDLAYALDFAMIDEGTLRNEQAYNELYYIKAALDTLCNSDYGRYFEYPKFVNVEQFIQNLMLKDGNKAQLVNININYIDDRFAKALTKIYSKIIFNFCKEKEERASMPFNIVLEEAHRYVQNDNDVNVIGYNIFERISKEGRKYGVLLGLITQRPKDLSETCLSQCNNFFLFKMLHPADLDFVSKVVPNITEQSIKKMKSLQPGKCLTFGTAFKLPTIVKIDIPDPLPSSSSCNVSNIWF